MEHRDIRAEGHRVIADYEDFIRCFIVSALNNYYDNWLEGVPAADKGEGMLYEWKKKRKSDTDLGMATEQALIYHANFSDYKQIIEHRKNWRKIFEGIFLPSNKYRVLVYMDDIAGFRHKIAHSKGGVSEEELSHILHEINWIKDKAGARYPRLLTDRKYDTDDRVLSVDLENIGSDLQIRFRHLINECLRKIEDSEKQGARFAFNEISALTKKEIDTSNGDHIIFILQSSFLKTYKHVYNYPFILQDYVNLFEYAYERGRKISDAVLKAFDDILDDEACHAQDIKKIEPLADLFLEIGIAFLNRDPEISRGCFQHLDDSSELMWSGALFSKLIIAGAKLVQIENPSDEVKSLKDYVLAGIEYNDEYAKGERYFTYIEDAFFYLDDMELITQERETAKKYDISKGEFYDKYLKPMMDRNMDKEIKGYIDFLEELSQDPERDYNDWFKNFEEFLSDINVAYEADEEEHRNVWEKISNTLAEKIAEGKNPEFKKMLEEFAVIEGSLVSDLIKKVLFK